MATFLLRLPDNELDALRDTATTEQRSMNDLARDAIRQAIDHGSDREQRMLALADRVIADNAGLLKRLADQ